MTAKVVDGIILAVEPASGADAWQAAARERGLVVEVLTLAEKESASDEPWRVVLDRIESTREPRVEVAVYDFEASWAAELTEGIEEIDPSLQRIVVGDLPGWHVSNRIISAGFFRHVERSAAGEVSEAAAEALVRARQVRASLQFRDRFRPILESENPSEELREAVEAARSALSEGKSIVVRGAKGSGRDLLPEYLIESTEGAWPYEELEERRLVVLKARAANEDVRDPVTYVALGADEWSDEARARLEDLIESDQTGTARYMMTCSEEAEGFRSIPFEEVRVPPLSERFDDLAGLCRHYLREAARTRGVRVPILALDAIYELEGHDVLEQGLPGLAAAMEELVEFAEENDEWMFRDLDWISAS